MKKTSILISLFSLFLCQKVHATYRNIFLDASNIITGTLPSYTLDPSSVTKYGTMKDGQAQITVASMTSVGTITSNGGFVGAIASPNVDASTAAITVRLNNLDVSTRTITEGNATSYVTINGSTQTKTGGLIISGTLTANKLVGDGQGISNIGGFVQLGSTQTFTGQNTFQRESYFNNAIAISSMVLTSNAIGAGLPLIFSSAPEFSLMRDGKLGIGTTAPMELVQIGKTGVGRQVLKLNAAGISGNPGTFHTDSNGDKIIFYDDTDSMDVRAGLGNSRDFWFKAISADISMGQFVFYCSSGSGATVERLRISTGVLVTGDFRATGAIAGASKNFQIPHPTNKNKWLIHSTVESDKYGLMYDGEAQLSDGQVTVSLPGYFEAIASTMGRTISLTCIDGFSPIYLSGKIENGQFIVRTDSGNSSQKFHWHISAQRGDPYIKSIGGIYADKDGKLIPEPDMAPDLRLVADPNNKESVDKALAEMRTKYKGYDKEQQ